MAKELIAVTEYLALYTRCRISRNRFNRVRQSVCVCVCVYSYNISFCRSIRINTGKQTTAVVYSEL
jgi:hypothetical protein